MLTITNALSALDGTTNSVANTGWHTELGALNSTVAVQIYSLDSMYATSGANNALRGKSMSVLFILTGARTLTSKLNPNTSSNR